MVIHSLLHVGSRAASSSPVAAGRHSCPATAAGITSFCDPDKCAQVLEPRHCCPLQAEISALQQKLVDGASMLRRAEQDSQALRQQLAELTIQRNKAHQVRLLFLCCAHHVVCTACSKAHLMMLEGFI